MPTYKWHGITANGKKCSGKLNALSEETLTITLRNQAIAVLFIKKIRESNTMLSLTEQIILLEHLGSLLVHGISIHQALEIFTHYHHKPSLTMLVIAILNDLQHGKSLSDSLKNSTRILPLPLIALVAAGEKSGTLGSCLNYLAEHLTRKQQLNRDIKAAIFLPGITIVIAFIIALGLILFVVPQFELLYISMEKTLPTSTIFLLNVSAWLRSPFSLCFIALLFTSIYITYKRQKTIFLSYAKSHTYYIKNLFLLSDLVHFMQTLAVFLKTGIPLAQALPFSAETIQNPQLKKNLIASSHLVLEGKSLFISLQATSKSYIPPEALSLIALGEQTGNLTLFIEKAASLTHQHLHTKLNTIKIILQPLAFVIIGFFIGGLLIILYLPIFNLASLV